MLMSFLTQIVHHAEALKGKSVNQKGYQTLVGGLLWFAIATRPDILYAVNVVVQFQQFPTTRAWTTAKRIARYLLLTSDIGITIDPHGARLVAFSDANHGDIALSDQLSISGGAYYLGGLLIHWTCQKQCTPAHSSMESELIVASNAAQEVIWLSHIAKEFSYAGPIEMKVDNKAAIDIANAHGLTRRVKHIEL